MGAPEALELGEVIETARRHGHQDAVAGKPLDRSYNWGLGSPTDTHLRSAYRRGYEEGRPRGRVGAEGAPTSPAASEPIPQPVNGIKKVPVRPRVNRFLIEQAAQEIGRAVHDEPGRPRRPRKRPQSRVAQVAFAGKRQHAAQIIIAFRQLQDCEKRLAAARRAGPSRGDLVAPCEAEKVRLVRRLLVVSGESTPGAARQLGAALSAQAAARQRKANRGARTVALRAAGPGAGPNRWATRVKGGGSRGGAKKQGPRPWVPVYSGGLPGLGKRR